MKTEKKMENKIKMVLWDGGYEDGGWVEVAEVDIRNEQCLSFGFSCHRVSYLITYSDTYLAS